MGSLSTQPRTPHPRVLGPREVKKLGSTLILNEWGTSEKKGGAVGCMETGGGGEYGPEVTVALGGRGDCQLHSSVPHPHPRSSVLEPLGPVGSRRSKPGWNAGLGGQSGTQPGLPAGDGRGGSGPSHGAFSFWTW